MLSLFFFRVDHLTDLEEIVECCPDIAIDSYLDLDIGQA